MTMPNERTRAIIYTRAFLLRLLDTRVTPRVPRNVRREAGRLLRHYPSALDLERPEKSLDPETAKELRI